MIGDVNAWATALSVSAAANNQLSATGLSYDASGNMMADGINTYGWNAESEIKTAAGVNYAYDGDGNRVSKSNGKLYWYGAGDDILAETDANGHTLNEYVFFGGKRVAMLPAGGSPNFYIEDFLGSSRTVVQSNGVPCYDADFTPYGGERVYTNTCAPSYKFEGKERDTETQNDDFDARYYSWRFGRWLSSDWSAIPAPVPYANFTNPQTLNLYSMVQDDPETFADLDGHDGCGAGGSGGGGSSTGAAGCVPSGLAVAAMYGAEIGFVGYQYQATGADSTLQQLQDQQQAPAGVETAGLAATQEELERRTLSSQGLDFIKRYEGYSGTVYRDSAGYPTIGYGHLIKGGEDFSNGITETEATALLAKDVQTAVNAVNKNVKVYVSQTQFDALVSFTYNVGIQNLGRSTLLANINSGQTVAKENFTNYNHSGGRIVQGLTIRRASEYNLFSKGVYAGP